MSKPKELDLSFDGIPCKRCGAPIPANLPGCPECCGLELEGVPTKRILKRVEGQQASFFDLANYAD